MPPYPTGPPAYLEGPFVAPPYPVSGLVGQLIGKRCSLSGDQSDNRHSTTPITTPTTAAVDMPRVAAALDAIVAGEAPSRSQSGGVVRPILRQLGYMAPVLDRAGGGAWRDMRRVAPPLAAIAFSLKVLRVRPRKANAREG